MTRGRPAGLHPDRAVTAAQVADRRSARTAIGRRQRSTLSMVAGFLALSAWCGAVGLATGWLPLGDRLTARLPFGSALVGGVALAVVVALPTTLLAVAALSAGSTVVQRATFVVGTIVVIWIVVELAFIRELSFLHPVILLYGAALMAWGRGGLSGLSRQPRGPIPPAPTPVKRAAMEPGPLRPTDED